MAKLTPRPGIMDIAPYKGGMSKDTSFKGKLSSNESALGPSPAAVDAFKQAADWSLICFIISVSPRTMESKEEATRKR